MNTPSMTAEEEHLWAEQMLPWLINGRLPREEAARLQAHLQQCERCRNDLRVEQRLAQQIAISPVVDFAPHGALARMMRRVDADSARAELPAAREEEVRGLRRTQRRGQRSPLAAALAVQAAALAVIAITVVWLAWRPAPNAEYQTLSAAPVNIAPQFQVVFSTDATAENIRATLETINAHIIDGPSRAGVFRIELLDTDPALSSQSYSAAAEILADDPYVQYVALIAPSQTP